MSLPLCVQVCLGPCHILPRDIMAVFLFQEVLANFKCQADNLILSGIFILFLAAQHLEFFPGWK